MTETNKATKTVEDFKNFGLDNLAEFAHNIYSLFQTQCHLGAFYVASKVAFRTITGNEFNESIGNIAKGTDHSYKYFLESIKIAQEQMNIISLASSEGKTNSYQMNPPQEWMDYIKPQKPKSPPVPVRDRSTALRESNDANSPPIPVRDRSSVLLESNDFKGGDEDECNTEGFNDTDSLLIPERDTNNNIYINNINNNKKDNKEVCIPVEDTSQIEEPKVFQYVGNRNAYGDDVEIYRLDRVVPTVDVKTGTAIEQIVKATGRTRTKVLMDSVATHQKAVELGIGSPEGLQKLFDFANSPLLLMEYLLSVSNVATEQKAKPSLPTVEVKAAQPVLKNKGVVSISSVLNESPTPIVINADTPLTTEVFNFLCDEIQSKLDITLDLKLRSTMQGFSKSAEHVRNAFKWVETTVNRLKGSPTFNPAAIPGMLVNSLKTDRSVEITTKSTQEPIDNRIAYPVMNQVCNESVQEIAQKMHLPDTHFASIAGQVIGMCYENHEFPGIEFLQKCLRQPNMFRNAAIALLDRFSEQWGVFWDKQELMVQMAS